MKPLCLAIATLLTAASNLQGQSQPDLKSGLVAYYPFDGDFQDKSAAANATINMGVELVADRIGNPTGAARFRKNSHLKASAAKLPSADRTVAFWFSCNDLKAGKYPGAGQVLLGYGGGACGRSFWIALNSIDVRNQYQTQGHCESNRLLGPINEDINEWHHFAITIQGTRITMYIDGVERARADSFSKSTLLGVADFIIGSNVSPTGDGPFTDKFNNSFDGKLDELRVYSRALTPAEIAALAPPAKPR